MVFLKFFLRCRIFQLGLFKREIRTTPQQNFSYIERGRPSPSKPSYLFVHGYSNSKEIFLDLIAWLPCDVHIIAVDLPGHGETMWNDDDVSIMYFVNHLKQFVDTVGLNKQKIHIIGESMGGHIAGVYSSLHPCDVTSATLMCPHGIKFDRMEKMKAEYEKTGHCILLPNDLKGVREMFQLLICKKFPFPDFVLKGILQMRLERDDFNRKLLRTLVSSGDKDLLERSLDVIKTPSMVLWGKEDQILDAVCVEKIQEKLSTLQKTVVFENVGHVLTIDCPKKVATNLMEFTTSL